VKISSVKDKKTGEQVTVKDCEEGHDGQYICKTSNCGANMSFVRFHEQRRHNKTIVIPSFFKLKSNEKHAYQVCPFNTQGAVDVIARESDSNILKSIGNKKYEFSLQVLHKENKHKQMHTLSDNDTGNRNSKEKKSKKYTGKGCSGQPFLASQLEVFQ
jgi:hypothetical protein